MADVWTNDTLRQMVRYIASDRKIARYLGCSIADVQAARRYCHETPENRVIGRPMPRPPAKGEILNANCEIWARDARQASQALAEALSRYRGANGQAQPG